jgi:flagellar secretion chaperone FliS
VTADPALAYRQASGQAPSPVRLVILLYEQLIEDLRQSTIALRSHDVEKRTADIGHALLIIGRLQSALDLEEGGEVASNLEHFYTLLRASLLDAQAHASLEVLNQQISHLLALREAWIEVEKTSRSSSASQADAPTVNTGDWNV